MWLDRVSNPGPLALESDALRGLARSFLNWLANRAQPDLTAPQNKSNVNQHCSYILTTYSNYLFS